MRSNLNGTAAWTCSHTVPIANRARHSPQPTALSKILPGPPTSGAGPLETPEWKASFPFSQKSSGEITDSDISVMLANCSIGSQKIALGSPSRSGAVSAPPPAPSVDMEERGSPAPWRLTEHTGVRPSSRWPQNRPWTAMILARQQEEDQETPPNRWVVSGTRERRDQSRGDLNQSRRHGVVPVAVSGLRRTSPGGFGGERDDASHRVHVAGGSRRREEERFLADGCPGSGSGTSVVRSRPTIGPFCRRSGLLAAVSTEEDDDELEQGEVRNDGGGVGSEGRYLLIAGPDSLHEAASTPRESLAPPDALESGQSSWPSPEVRATSMDRSAFLERQGPALTAVASPVAPAPQHLDARAELATQTSLPQPFAVSPSFSGTPHDGRSVADAPADLRLSSRFGPVSGTSHFASLSEEPEEQTGDVVGKPVGRESSQGPALHLAVLPQNRGPVHLVSTAQDPTQAEVLRMRSSPGRLDIGEPSFTSGSSPSNAPVAYAELPVSPLAPTVSPADHRAGRRYLETLAVSPSLQPRPASGRREEDGKLFQRSEPASPYASSFAGAASPCADGNVHEGNSEPPHAGSAEHLGFACRRPARLGARQESAEGRAERSECRTFGPQTQVLGTRSPLHVTRSLSREPETFRAGKDTLSSFLPVASSPGFFGPPVTYMPEADARAARRPNASRFALRRGAGSLFSASPEVDCGTDTLLGVQLHALPSSSLGLDREAKSVPRDCRASSPSHGLSGASHCASRCRRLSPSGADRQPGTSQALLPVPTGNAPFLKRSVSGRPLHTHQQFSSVRRSASNLSSSATLSPGRDGIRRRQNGGRVETPHERYRSTPVAGDPRENLASSTQHVRSAENRCAEEEASRRLESSKHVSPTSARPPRSFPLSPSRSPRACTPVQVSAAARRSLSPARLSGGTTPRTLTRPSSRPVSRSLSPRPSSHPVPRSLSPAPARLLSPRTVSSSLSPRRPSHLPSLLPGPRSPSRPRSRVPSPRSPSRSAFPRLPPGESALSDVQGGAVSPSSLPSPSLRHAVRETHRGKSTERSPSSPRNHSQTVHPRRTELNPPAQWRLLELAPEPLPLHYPTGTAARALAAYSRPGTTCSVCSPLSRSRPNSPPSPWTAHQRPDPSGEYGRRSEHGKAEFHSSGPGRPGAAGLASSQVDSPTPGSLTASGSRGQLEGSPDPTGSYIMSQSPPAVSLAPGVLGPVSEEHSIIQPLVLDDTVAELSIPLAISYTVAAEMADRPDR